MLQHKRTFSRYSGSNNDFSLTACGGGGATKDPGSDAAQDPNEAAGSGHAPAERVGRVPPVSSTRMRPMRNCTKAKEEGKVTIYSISSRITKGRQCLYGEVSRR